VQGERAKRARREAIYAAFTGRGNAMQTGTALRALDYEEQHKRKIARPLLTPEEVLGMSQAQALVMASGYAIPAFMAEKTPYFTNPAYTGLYGPNPYFDRGLEVVTVPGRWGGKSRLRLIREAVPSSHAHLPQYAHGEWSFIEGHRPKS
jgi:type IV secretion system protein VirD4